MATRSRTLLFINFRSSFARSASHRLRTADLDQSENAGLIANESRMSGEVVVELSVLPPRWVDIVDEIEEDINHIKEKLIQIESLYKKTALPGFDDRFDAEESIERVSEDITRLFQACQRKIKAIQPENQQRNDQDKVKKNIQSSLATKLQDLSNQFRKTQSNYLKKLRGQELKATSRLPAANNTQENAEDDEDLDAVFTDAQMLTVSNNERAISEREREINELAKSIVELAMIFKDLQTMVIDQGTILDRIDYNIEQTNIHLEDGHKELVKASTLQSNKAGTICIILLAGLVFIMFIVIWIKIALKKKK